MQDEDYEYPRETTERVYFKEMIIQGAAPESTLDVSLTRGLDRPLTWAPISFDAVEGKYYFLLSPSLVPSEYTVFVRSLKPSTNQEVVVDAGRIRVT